MTDIAIETFARSHLDRLVALVDGEGASRSLGYRLTRENLGLAR